MDPPFWSPLLDFLLDPLLDPFLDPLDFSVNIRITTRPTKTVVITELTWKQNILFRTTVGHVVASGSHSSAKTLAVYNARLIPTFLFSPILNKSDQQLIGLSFRDTRLQSAFYTWSTFYTRSYSPPFTASWRFIPGPQSSFYTDRKQSSGELHNFWGYFIFYLQISEGQISDCSEVISETQVQLFRWIRKINTDHRNEWHQTPDRSKYRSSDWTKHPMND